jgi:hypothetical protein
MEKVGPVYEVEPEEPTRVSGPFQTFLNGFFPPMFENPFGRFISKAVDTDDDFRHGDTFHPINLIDRAFRF